MVLAQDKRTVNWECRSFGHKNRKKSHPSVWISLQFLSFLLLTVLVNVVATNLRWAWTTWIWNRKYVCCASGCQIRSFTSRCHRIRHFFGSNISSRCESYWTCTSIRTSNDKIHKVQPQLKKVWENIDWSQFSPPKMFGNVWWKFSWQNPILKL